MKYQNKFIALLEDADYNPVNALSLAVACALSTQGKKKIWDTVVSWGYKPVGFLSVDKSFDIDTQCYVMENDYNVVVVFRGSDSWKDWAGNVQIDFDEGPFGAKVHGGFQDALLPVANALTQYVNKGISEGKRLWITGHSLGGALASLYAAELVSLGIDVYGVYTYGSPKPGDTVFARTLAKRITGPYFRVENENDLVPDLPPPPYDNSGERILLKRFRSPANVWDSIKIYFAKMSDKLSLNDAHTLSDSQVGYIPQLIKSYKRYLKR